MHAPTIRNRRPIVLIGLIFFSVILLLLLVALAAGRSPQSQPPVILTDPTATALAPPESAEVPTADGLAAGSPTDGESSSAAEPRWIRIPAIDVAADTIPLGIRADGAIEVPQDYAKTGWWVDGPEPGEPGPAVVLGHVDSVDGPAIFSRLPDLSIGDAVHIDRTDGTTVSYRVDRIEQHPKDDFPTEAVYGGGEDESVLRLVTCGGEFDRGERSYVDNIIVFASPLSQ